MTRKNSHCLLKTMRDKTVTPLHTHGGGGQHTVIQSQQEGSVQKEERKRRTTVPKKGAGDRAPDTEGDRRPDSKTQRQKTPLSFHLVLGETLLHLYTSSLFLSRLVGFFPPVKPTN